MIFSIRRFFFVPKNSHCSLKVNLTGVTVSGEACMYKCIIHSWFFCIVSICLPKEVDGVINVLVRRGMGKGEDFVSNKHSWMVVAESSNYIHPILWLICNCIRKDSLIGRKYSFIAFHVLVNCEVFYCTIDSQHDLWYVHTSY